MPRWSHCTLHRTHERGESRRTLTRRAPDRWYAKQASDFQTRRKARKFPRFDLATDQHTTKEACRASAEAPGEWYVNVCPAHGSTCEQFLASRKGLRWVAGNVERRRRSPNTTAWRRPVAAERRMEGTRESTHKPQAGMGRGLLWR